MWSISTGVEDERLDAAFEFIKFLASPAYQIPQVLAGGVPPRNSVALNAPEVSEFYPFLTDELRQGYLDSVGVPSALNAGDVELVLTQLWGEIITGVDATPAELAAKYQPLLDALG
jgi:ABC-type glycerol-3-phosphate transport system substrate-binding protein